VGATNMQYAAHVPTGVGGFIEGLILVLFLMSIPVAFARWRPSSIVASLRPRRRTEG
jgi:hypothetical protein